MEDIQYLASNSEFIFMDANFSPAAARKFFEEGVKTLEGLCCSCNFNKTSRG